MMPAVLFRVTLLLLFLDKWNKRQKLSPRGSGKLSTHISFFLTLQQLFQHLILSHFMIGIFLTCKAVFFLFHSFLNVTARRVCKEHNFCVCINILSWLSILSQALAHMFHHCKQSAKKSQFTAPAVKIFFLFYLSGPGFKKCW